MSWTERPYPGEVWLQNGSRGERRTVVDRDYGGDVYFRRGGPKRYGQTRRCSESAWLKWQRSAKLIERGQRYCY